MCLLFVEAVLGEDVYAEADTWKDVLLKTDTLCFSGNSLEKLYAKFFPSSEANLWSLFCDKALWVGDISKTKAGVPQLSLLALAFSSQ